MGTLSHGLGPLFCCFITLFGAGVAKTTLAPPGAPWLPPGPPAPCIRMGGMKDNFVFECFDQNNGLNPPDKVRQSHSNIFWGVWGCFWGSSLFWGVLCISAKLRFWPELTYPLDKIENGVRFCSGRIQVTLKHFTGVLYNIMRYIDQRLCVKGTHRG